MASIAGGAAAPAISLASSSSVSVDPNVTLTIASPIGNPQTGVTTLTKIGAGTLVLSGTNSYTGGTLVESGTLIAMNPSVIASGTELIVGSAAAKFDLAAAAMQTSSSLPFPGPPRWLFSASAASLCWATGGEGETTDYFDSPPP